MKVIITRNTARCSLFVDGTLELFTVILKTFVSHFHLVCITNNPFIYTSKLKNSFVFNESRLQEVLMAWRWEWVMYLLILFESTYNVYQLGCVLIQPHTNHKRIYDFFDSISADFLRVVVSWLYITSYQFLENHLRAYTDFWWSNDSSVRVWVYYCTTQIHNVRALFLEE